MHKAVYVFKRKGRTNYVCQWNEKGTGRKRMKSTGVANRREAMKRAKKIAEKNALISLPDSGN